MAINYDAYGKALSLLYEDRVTAIADVQYKDDEGVTKTKKGQIVVDDKPCRLSFGSVSNSGTDGDYVVENTKDVLTTPIDVIIPIGSDVVVTRKDGTVYHYSFSDKPSIHSSHRRYVLNNEELS